MMQIKLGCRSRKQKRKNQPIEDTGVKHCHWIILPLLILLETPTMQFSLDHKRRSHKQNHAVFCFRLPRLIFTRLYRSTLSITTPTPTSSLVKSSLERSHGRRCSTRRSQRSSPWNGLFVFKSPRGLSFRDVISARRYCLNLNQRGYHVNYLNLIQRGYLRH